MAARKKVTKKASNATVKSAPIRSPRKGKRASGAKKAPKSGARTVKGEKVKDKLKSAKAAPVAKAKTVSSRAKVKPATVAASKRRGGSAKLRAGAPRVEKASAAKAVAKKPQVRVVEPAKSDNKSVEAKAFARTDAKGIELASRRPEPVAAPAPAPVKTLAASPAPVVLARAVEPEAPPKATKAPAPAKIVDRDLPSGEQKTMKSSGNKHGFKLNEFVVYPAHGVGQIVAMEEQEVAGFRLELFVINFVKDKMTLRVPTSKVTGVGMRKLSDPDAARRSLEILTGRARIKRTMWSRRAQEYEAKINSGDINAIAEVVRDLYRSEAQPEQSYSERQLYEAALDRMMREIAAVQKLSETETLKLIETQLKKNQRRGAKPEGQEGEDAGIEEAA
jgi:CarD family transcriptional regulator